MNMPVNSISKRRAHPMLIVASTAVVLFAVTGTAAVLGWIPNSFGRTAPADTVALAAPDAAPAPVHHVAVKAQPLRMASAQDYSPRHEQWVHHATAQACRNCGIVESMRDVASNGNDSGLGAAGGAVVGGLLGNQVGGGHGRDAMTVVGAIGGALAGNQIEKQVKTTHSYRTTVRMTDGSTRSVAQATQPEWRDGDHVRIVDGVVTLAG
ncbi:MAG: glycine zipper 2TM domain-containing protein [Telluria sp.]